MTATYRPINEGDKTVDSFFQKSETSALAQ